METVKQVFEALAIILGLLFGLSAICATIWAFFDWLFNRYWSWTDKFVSMLSFFAEVLSRTSYRTTRSYRRSSSSGFKGGSSRGGGAGRSF